MRASATILAILLTTAGPALAGFLRSTKPAGIDGCPVGWERYHDDGTEGHDSCFTEQLLKQDASWEDAVLSCMEAHEVKAVRYVAVRNFFV